MPQPAPLDVLTNRLREREPRRRRCTYRIPTLWNSFGYGEFERAGRGELCVDPHRFLLACLDKVILPARGDRRLAGRSLSRAQGVRRDRGSAVRLGRDRRRGGDWIKQASLYALLVRTTTTWDHDGDGQLRDGRWTESGTFLKTIMLLPMLRRMGCSALYLLPVTKVSRRFKKGELGCPYAARNLFELEPDLHDQLLGRSAEDVELEFAALVESAHALGMHVLVDLAPRTTARDSDLLLEHPEWFYWIDKRAERSFGPPPVESCSESMPTRAQLGAILREPAVQAHLARFRWAPSQTDPARWRAFVARCRREQPRDVLGALERTFQLTTAPAFSDCLNDPQPLWSDVTYLRLFLDHPAASARHLPAGEAQPPYAFTDSIKASLFPGRRPNRALWKQLAGVLPWYQRFGVDGARVDMGHALPAELQEMIVSEARRRDPDFCFLAEEFNPDRAKAAKRNGYNAIIGPGCFMEPRAKEGELQRFAHEVLPTAELPALACAELPDTPRAATRPGGKAFVRLTTVLNHFLPNSVPLLTSGTEVYERQPMSVGLDMPEGARFALPKRDPLYGKLAFFDRYALHWTNAGAAELMDLHRRAAWFRMMYLSALSDPNGYFQPRVTTNARSILAVGWHVPRDGAQLLVIANLDHERPRRATLERLPGSRRARPATVAMELVASTKPAQVKAGRLSLMLEPGDVKLLVV